MGASFRLAAARSDLAPATCRVVTDGSRVTLFMSDLCRIGEEARVTTGPADEQAAPPRRPRASHADREQAISALEVAFVHGRSARPLPPGTAR
jgi:hypothetical protein